MEKMNCRPAVGVLKGEGRKHKAVSLFEEILSEILKEFLRQKKTNLKWIFNYKVKKKEHWKE